MAGSLNRVQLIGHVGADPEIRRTQDGRPIGNFRLATSERWTDKASGEKRERTEWHTVVVFNENLCKILEQYIKKGAYLYVEGQLQTRKWQDQQGQDRYSTEVVLQAYGGTITMLDKLGNGQSKDYSSHDRDAQAKTVSSGGRSASDVVKEGYKGDMSKPATMKGKNGIDDEIPF